MFVLALSILVFTILVILVMSCHVLTYLARALSPFPLSSREEVVDDEVVGAPAKGDLGGEDGPDREHLRALPKLDGVGVANRRKRPFFVKLVQQRVLFRKSVGAKAQTERCRVSGPALRTHALDDRWRTPCVRTLW